LVVLDANFLTAGHAYFAVAYVSNATSQLELLFLSTVCCNVRNFDYFFISASHTGFSSWVLVGLCALLLIPFYNLYYF